MKIYVKKFFMSDNYSLELFEKQTFQLQTILNSFIDVTYPTYNELYIKTHKQFLLSLLWFLKNDTNYQFKHLIDIVAVDEPGKTLRFTVIYCLLSITYNQRIQIAIQTNEVDAVNSICTVFKNANWAEREIWDLFGIKFIAHPDLRRILTDYGFEGFPLRKDFPLTGYKEVMYSDTLKSIKYGKVELSQAYRTFKYFNPWTDTDHTTKITIQEFLNDSNTN